MRKTLAAIGVVLAVVFAPLVAATGPAGRLSVRRDGERLVITASVPAHLVLLAPGGAFYPAPPALRARRLVVVLAPGSPPGRYTAVALTDDGAWRRTVTVQRRVPAPPGVTPFVLLERYGVGALYARGLLGQGTTIALDTPAAPSAGDVARFDRIFRLPPPDLRYLACDPHDREAPVARAEADIDVEWAHAVAPQARIDLLCPYGAVPPEPDAVALAPAEAAFAGADTFSVSMEWLGLSRRQLAALGDPRLFLPVPVRRPLTVFVASGDTGRTGAAWPQDDPHVLDVGGTMWRRGRAVYWKDGSAGGGWGAGDWPRPSWQRIPGPRRRIPDFSLNASGYLGVVGGRWIRSEGTSFAAPIAAAMFALLDQDARRSGEGSLGWVNARLYALAASPFGSLVFRRGGDTGPAVWRPRLGLGVPDLVALDFFLVRGPTFFAGTTGTVPMAAGTERGRRRGRAK